MKMLYLFLMLGFYSNAQMSYFGEYKGSYRIVDTGHKAISNSIVFGIKRQKTLFSIGLGREDWKYDPFNKKEYLKEISYGHCSSNKIIFNINHEYKIPKTKLSILYGIEFDLYFMNKLDDSLSLSNNGRYRLSKINRKTLGNFPISSANAVDGGLDHYYYITNMPFAMRGNLSIQYSFKKWGFKVYYEPYFIRVKYKNAEYQDETGKTAVYFNDIGIGVNYQLNFKQKQEKEK